MMGIRFHSEADEELTEATTWRRNNFGNYRFMAAGPRLSPTWNPRTGLAYSGYDRRGRLILDDFECLPDLEKREVLSNLLRISRDTDYPEVGDDELVAAADAVFLECDRMERNN